MTLYNRVFLADDDADDRDLFMDALQEIDSSITCQHAFDGEMALKLLTADFLEKPEIIILDLNMPKINGKEVLKQLKSTSEMSSVPIIMFSTFFSPNDIEEITRLGASHYMIKHTNFQDLCKSLKKVLTHPW